MLNIIVMLIFAGAALYIISIIPIHATIKTIIYVVVIVMVAVYVLKALAPALGAF